MLWLNTTFKEYCKKQGYDIMQADIQFIEKTLQCFPTHQQRPVLFEYCKVWQIAMDAETNINKKQSCGRREANQFLLHYRDKNK